ncbi:MAG: PrsW family glutamic-type intramembrane protease [Anaerolineales bacterium]|jgi:hypothetical protein
MSADLPRRFDWLSAFQFAFSALAALLGLAAALLFGLMAAVGMLMPAAGPMPSNDLSLWMLAASASFTALLLLPSAWFALQRLSGRGEQAAAPQPPLKASLGWLLPLPLIILAGYGLTRLGSPWNYFLPVLNILAITLTAGWLFAVGSRGLSLGSRQRFWGVLAGGAVLGPVIILMVEVVFLVIFLVVAVANLASDQVLLERLAAIMENVPNSPQASEELFTVLRPFLSRPVVLYAVLAFAAGLVPLVEEAFKPIAVWLLYRRPLTSTQGYVAGLLSGAGYGLFESLSLAMGGENWALVVTTRAGTTLLHILASGLVGWGLAGAFQRGRFGRLVLAYLSAVLLHGTWNGLTLISTAGELGLSNFADNPILQMISRVAPVGLILLIVGLFAALILLNRAFPHPVPGTEMSGYNGAILPAQPHSADVGGIPLPGNTWDVDQPPAGPAPKSQE